MVTGDNQNFIPHASTNREIFMTFKEGYIQTGNVILLGKQLNNVFDMVDFINQHEENVEDFFISSALQEVFMISSSILSLLQ